ncbi:MAG: cysteine hydrolase family protein [Bryobacteraceae bacterium]|jgi:nicotinamidase-related amidase
MAVSPSRSRSALLIVDLQLGMFNGKRLAPIHAGETLLLNTRMVIERANHVRVPVIFVRHAGPVGHLLEEGTPDWRIHPAIAPRSGERVIDKRTPDSFHETSLSSDLAVDGIDRLIVMGAQTEVCVDTTCRRAFSLGFGVTLVSDGHSTWDNATLTADQIIRHTNDTLAGWFVRLARVGEIGEYLQ